MNLVRYVWSIREKSSRESDNEYIRILFERQKEQILVHCRAKIQKHEFQAETDDGSILEFIDIIDSQRTEIDHRDQSLLHEELSEQNRVLGEIVSSFCEMWDWREFEN